MTKVPATKKMQTSANLGALWPFHASNNLTQAPDMPLKNIRYMGKEIINLRKDLVRSRFLIQSVKIGRGYFTILREESAMKKRQQKLQKLQEEEKNKFQPAKKFSEIQYGDTFMTRYDEDKFKKAEGGSAIVLRPFTPIHSCIISPSLPVAHVDPGGSKSTIKKINKDKSMGQKWEHFITTPKKSLQTQDMSRSVWKESKGIHILNQTKKLKVPTVRTTSRKPSRRGSTLSLSRTSGGSSPQSSMLSVNPGSDEPPSVATQVTGSKDIEDNDSSSTKQDEEPLHINLQKLLEMVREDARRTVMMENGLQRKVPSILTVIKQTKSNSAFKDMQTTHKSSERSSSTSGESHTQVALRKIKSRANRDIVQCKSGVCGSLRAKFYSVAQEAGFCLQDKMEIFRKRQEERGLQKFHSFVLVSNFQKDIAKMRHQVSVAKGDAEEIADHWYFDLLSKLPEDLKNFRPAKKILVKLQKFGENLDLRIRPHVLLKVLQDLRIWELCSPNIAVAIEFVREHIIHMPQEDYISWLQNRINIPIRPQSAPV
ncbi:coiled-coil domain-containing protein 60 isoform X5 [Dasypus novemcinctus]|uniref:coiled-coil domain-containing protein 60 isoform X5 n=1 Tax=Dasypus novemcinctus TaxID=9361 RepID=UPI00265EE299|nr:coiled-coil domain-containing protein 60 isoform X5 [Dasypus novemcinctus]